MKKYLKLVLLILLTLTLQGCFIILAVGNNDFEVTDDDSPKARDIAADLKLPLIP